MNKEYFQSSGIMGLQYPVFVVTNPARTDLVLDRGPELAYAKVYGLS